MNVFEKWKEKATRYVDVRVQLAKLSFIERTSTVLGTLISMLVLLFLGLAFLTFLGLSLMEVFIKMLDDNRVGGTLLTTAFFALLIGLVVLMRKSIIKSFAGIFIKIMTDPGDDEEDDHKAFDRDIKVEGDDDDDDDE